MKLYFKRGVMSGFIITILAIGVLGVYAYINIRQLIDGSVIQSRSLLIATYAERVLSIAVDLEAAQRGYVITGDSAYLEPYQNAVRSIDRNVALLEKVSEPFPEKKAGVEEVKRLVKQKMEFVTGTIEARNQGFEAAHKRMLTGEGRRITGKIRTAIDEIRKLETDVYQLATASSYTRLDVIQYSFSGALIVPAVIVVILFVAINSNLNQREQAQRDLQKANEDITTLNHELESFTYSVSHDLRAPLRSVNGYANVLMEDYGEILDDQARQTIGIIARNGTRMGELIDDLLNFSRLGRKEIQRTMVSMNDIVHQAIDEIRETKHYKVNTSINRKDLPDVYADASMMRQVWYNLISNAIKYSSKSGNPTVEIGSVPNGGEVCYYVKDNGVGFNMAYVDKLFGIFQRLHKQDEFEGTGVGLALIKRIVDRHNGRVWAEGELDKGATFYFTIPLT